MHLASFLSRRGEQYERLDRAAKVQEEGSVSDGEGEREGEEEGEGDCALLCKTHHHEEPSRLRTSASPWRRTGKPLDGTMNLLIRRMDNTTFVIEVRKRASMLDLKEAIQKKFQASGNQVSWPHVWGHFCLSFKDQKLLQEHLSLHKLGIGELDELVFVRHLDTRAFNGCPQRSFLTSLRRKHFLKC